MTTQFKEGSRYLLEQSIFNRHILEVTYVDNTTAYLKLQGQETLTDYRYGVKSGKMHKWNNSYQSWDLVEGYTLTEYGPAQPEFTHYDYSKVRVD